MIAVMQARTETISVTKCNKRVITFLYDLPIDIELQGSQVLKAIKAGSPILRAKLVADLAPVIVSKRRISDVVSFWLNQLKKYGVIKIQEFEDWEKEQGNHHEQENQKTAIGSN